MHEVRIKPVWTLTGQHGEEAPPRLIELLVQVQAHGSLSAACKASGASYRHAWSLIREGEALLGHPLLTMSRGKGSSLTALGDKLVWAHHRIQARLGTQLASLASELQAEIERVVAAGHDVIRLHASHGFAVETLVRTLTDEADPPECKYMGSQEAVVSWHGGHCELAGFHVPTGRFEAQALAHYRRWLTPDCRLLHVTRRRQGFFVARGNPLNIRTVDDLARAHVRFVNRQASSGSRFLLECMLREAAIDPQRIHGYDLSEYTHAAVAAYVASGMADVGFGVEPPAHRFGLDFVPLATERYMLVCREADLPRAGVQHAISVLRSTAYQQMVNALPGYRVEQGGEVQTLAEAFPNAS